MGGLAALSQFDPSRSSAAKFAVITMQLSFNDVVGYGPRLEGSYEATQIYYCSRRRSRMAACGAGAGTGADLSSGLLAAGYARYAAFFSTNCDATVSLKAKTSRSNIAHMGYTLI